MLPRENTDIALLVLRIGVGAIFIFAGWGKVSDMHATIAGFAQMGFSPFWTYVASYAEFLGGIAVLIGFGTRIASVFLCITMIVATYVLRENMVQAISPLSLLFSTAALCIAGAGKYALKKGY